MNVPALHLRMGTLLLWYGTHIYTAASVGFVLRPSKHACVHLLTWRDPVRLAAAAPQTRPSLGVAEVEALFGQRKAGVLPDGFVFCDILCVAVLLPLRSRIFKVYHP